MKVLFIGDIHCNNDWEKIVHENLITNFVDHVVFLGDYLDSFTINGHVCKENLRKFFAYAKEMGDKCSVLLGNHDYAYIQNRTGITGYNYPFAEMYRQLFSQYKDILKIAWGYENPTTHKYTLATHAGLTYTYWRRYLLTILQDPDTFIRKIVDVDPVTLPLHEILNYMIDKPDILWKVGSHRGGAGTGGVLWADYLEIIEDRYPGINQVFGHTPKASVQVNTMDDDLIVCCDSWMNKRTAHIVLTL